MAFGNDGPPVREYPFTVLIGNPKRHSRTRRVVLRAAELLRADLAGVGVALADPRILDLAELAPALFTLPDEQRRAVVVEALDAAGRGHLLLVGSPTYKGTFTGLLKLFVDQLPKRALNGTVAVPLMTAASLAYQHAVESYLRPLLVALGAAVPAVGTCVLEAQFGAPDEVLAGWSAQIAPVVGAVLSGQSRAAALTGTALTGTALTGR